MKLTHCTFAIALGILSAVAAAAQTAPQSTCEGIPPGRHAQLERMTAAMNLTCEQQLKIEPLLHDEESVTQPLLRFQSFSDDQRSEVMSKIKMVARRQIKSQLTPEQQKWMDQDIESVSKGGKSGGGKKGAAKSAGSASGDPLADEETLSKAVMAYSALYAEEKKSIVLAVKKAARNDEHLQLSSEQQKKLDAEIGALSK